MRLILEANTPKGEFLDHDKRLNRTNPQITQARYLKWVTCVLAST